MTTWYHAVCETTWYHAVCDEHRQHMVVLITFNGRRSTNCDIPLAEPGVQFLEEHVECNLRLIHRDSEFDAIYGYDEMKLVSMKCTDECRHPGTCVRRSVDESLLRKDRHGL